MAVVEGFTIEDNVVIMKNQKKNRICVCCRPVHLCIAIIIVLLILAIVGVILYFYVFPRQSKMDLPWQGRLPLSVVPLRYNLTITPYFYPEDVPAGRQNFTFDGNVSIAIRCKERTNQITLHIWNIDILELSVYNETDGSDLANGYEEDINFDFLKIYLTEDLVADSVYVVNIEYIGILEEEALEGFFIISFIDENGEMRLGGITQMQPTSARAVIPCFDEPQFKAEFDVTIRHRSDMTALSNGIELSSIDLEDTMNGWKETVFKTTPKMSSYLLAFAITHFVSLNKTTVSGTLVRVWSRPQDINHTIYALESAVKQTEFFESYFNYSYTLDKQDMVAVPFFLALAMENWGLIIYHENAMIYNPEVESLDQKQIVGMVVSHELAHQWFGNLVTPVWWDDLWLNEGFARYLEYLGVDYCEPEWKAGSELFLEYNNMVAMKTDSSSETHPLRQNVNTPTEISSIFDSITYEKGAAVVHILVDILGEDVFVAALRDYLKEHAYSNTNTGDLWEALTKADIDHGGHDIKTIMDTWTLQPFYPLVMFNRTTDTTITASQKIFLPYDETKEKFDELRPTYGNIMWEILLSYTHESKANFTHPTKDWLHREDKVELTLSDDVQSTDWYLVNIKRTGYYRVNYDETNWNRLSEQLLQNHELIPVQNRFQLLDDATILFETDELDIRIVLNMTLYLHQEMEYLPWRAAVILAGKLRRLMKLQPSYGLVQKHWQEKISPVYRHIGWKINVTEENLKTLMHRVQIIQAACYFHYEDCLQTASEIYATYMADPTNNPIPNSSELRRYIYCYAIMEGGVREWEFGEQQLLSLSPDERDRDTDWIYGLSCTTQPWLLNRLLQDAYDEKLGYWSFDYVINYVSKHDIGLPIAWEYVQQHWDEMWDLQFDDDFYSWMLEVVVTNMFTEVHLQQLLEFGENRDFGKGSSVEKQYEWAINKVKYNIEKRELYSDEVTRWLSQQYEPHMSYDYEYSS